MSKIIKYFFIFVFIMPMCSWGKEYGGETTKLFALAPFSLDNIIVRNKNDSSVPKEAKDKQKEWVRVTSDYGPRNNPGNGGSSNHGGVDYGIPVGTKLYAQADGKIIAMTTKKQYDDNVKQCEAAGCEWSCGTCKGYTNTSKSCQDYNAQASCNADNTCVWNVTKKSCDSKVCNGSTQDSCTADKKCSWNTTNQSCRPKTHQECKSVASTMPAGIKTVICYGNGLSVAYFHLSNHPSGLKDGDKVTAGQIVGYSGDTGAGCSVHLHYQVAYTDGQDDCRGWANNENKIDPLCPVDFSTLPYYFKTDSKSTYRDKTMMDSARNEYESVCKGWEYLDGENDHWSEEEIILSPEVEDSDYDTWFDNL